MRKVWYKSKTFWVGVVALIGGISVDTLRLFVNDEKAVARIMAVLGLLTIVCRCLTGDLKAKKDDQ